MGTITKILKLNTGEEIQFVFTCEHFIDSGTMKMSGSALQNRAFMKVLRVFLVDLKPDDRMNGCIFLWEWAPSFRALLSDVCLGIISEETRSEGDLETLVR